jgi:hypothetical protein
MAKLKEQRAFSTFKEGSIGKLNLKRIETSTTSGMPDVIGTNRNGFVFWMEVKALDHWPKRDSTLPLKGMFEKGQLSFLCEWNSWKGNAFILLRVGLEYYLLIPSLALPCYTQSDLIEYHCLAKGKDKVINYLIEARNEN